MGAPTRRAPGQHSVQILVEVEEPTSLWRGRQRNCQDFAALSACCPPLVASPVVSVPCRASRGQQRTLTVRSRRRAQPQDSEEFERRKRGPSQEELASEHLALPLELMILAWPPRPAAQEMLA